jgi:hypothetical protein
MPDIDFTRKVEIYKNKNKILLDYYIDNSDFDVFYVNLLKNISKIIFNKIDQDIGILFYICCVNKMDINISNKFYDFYKNKTNGIKIKEILQMFKDAGFNNINSFIEIIKNEIYDDDANFITRQKKFENSKLSSIGVDIVITLPRKSDFNGINTIKKYYTLFRENYFEFLINFMENNDEQKIIEYIVESVNNIYELKTITKPLLNLIYNKLQKNKVEIENKFNVKLNDYLPFLIDVKLTKNQIEGFFTIDKQILKGLVDEKLKNIIDNNFDYYQKYIKKIKFIDEKIIDSLFIDT